MKHMASAIVRVLGWAQERVSELRTAVSEAAARRLAPAPGFRNRRAGCLKRALVAVAMLQAFSLGASAQGDEGREVDAHLWVAASVDVRLHEAWRLGAGSELRLRDDFTRFHQSNTFAALTVAPTSWVHTTAGYRLRVQNEDEGSSIEHRVYLNLKFRQRFGRFRLTQRLRAQVDAEERRTGLVTRARLAMAYRVSRRWRPFLSGEAFVRTLGFEGGASYRKTRVLLGTKVRFGHSELALYTGIDWIEGNRPRRNHIVGIEFEQAIDLARDSEGER